MNEQIDDNVKELIARSLAGDISAALQQQLADWLAVSGENQKAYEKYKKALQLTDEQLGLRQSEVDAINTDEEWKRFLEKINNEGAPVRKLHEPKSFRWLKVAATLLLLAVCSYAVYFLANRNGTQHFETASNTLKVELPDGSTVVLNRHSSLTFNEDYNTQTRSLKFEGEGFFDVEPNASKPFIVELKHAHVEVVGTSFNILAYDSLKEMAVTVKTGVVKVTDNRTNKEVKVRAGEQATYSKIADLLASEPISNMNYLSWETHEITFNEATLPAVIETLNKTYNAHLVLVDNVSDSCTVTVQFSNQSLESVLRVLENTLNLKYTVKGNVIEITASGC